MAYYEGGKRSRYFEAGKKRSVLLDKLQNKPKEYPVIEPRGYYSEVVTNEAAKRYKASTILLGLTVNRQLMELPLLQSGIYITPNSKSLDEYWL